ncbi:MAG: aminoglycoside phosphotransferase family protein [bacterium]
MDFKKNIISLYGRQGQQWLDDLPKLVEQCAAQWNLSELKVMGNLSFNYVLAGMQKNTPVILKLGFSKPGIQREANALEHFAGHGCVKLLDQDISYGALLLQRAVPGETLKTFFPEQDMQATKIACQILQDLHNIQNSPDSKKFEQLSDNLKILDKKWDIQASYLNKAKTLHTHLLATTTKTVLLHRDLHHENILSCGLDKWVAIDPLGGVIGDPAYDVGSFIRNPMPELLDCPDVKNILQRRVTFFADYFNFDKQRIIDWVYVQLVLSACWAIEDNLDFKASLALVDIIEQIK